VSEVSLENRQNAAESSPRSEPCLMIDRQGIVQGIA
jgi:hypothetical protein